MDLFEDILRSTYHDNFFHHQRIQDYMYSYINNPYYSCQNYKSRFHDNHVHLICKCLKRAKKCLIIICFKSEKHHSVISGFTGNRQMIKTPWRLDVAKKMRYELIGKMG